jgi:hypothetical protein
MHHDQVAHSNCGHRHMSVLYSMITQGSLFAQDLPCTRIATSQAGMLAASNLLEASTGVMCKRIAWFYDRCTWCCWQGSPCTGQLSGTIWGGGGLLQVDTFTAERYSPHQITRHNSKVQAPAPRGATRSAMGVSSTALKRFFFCFC